MLGRFIHVPIDRTSMSMEPGGRRVNSEAVGCGHKRAIKRSMGPPNDHIHHLQEEAPPYPRRAGAQCCPSDTVACRRCGKGRCGCGAQVSNRRLSMLGYRISLPLVVLLLGLCRDWGARAMRTSRTWTSKPWCASVEAPDWPFAYSKYMGHSVETKGRVSSNAQDMRHTCAWWGVRSKCHRCELMACGDDLSSSCHYQIQGVDWAGISTNVPTVSDAPWAVNGSHRYDFGSAGVTHVCMLTSGAHCLSPFGSDYSNCSVRCWGHGFRGSDAGVKNHMAVATYVENADNPDAVDAWGYPKADGSFGNTSTGAPVYNPQGYAVTLAGGNGAGYRDGAGVQARFNSPQGVAVDANGTVYVADTGNHRIRMVRPDGTVTTIAGTGVAGHRDGHGSQAQFSSPAGLAVWHDTLSYSGDASQGEVVLFVADTDNHRIRRIHGLSSGNIFVTCFAGQCGNGTSSFSETLRAAPPRPGYADGEGDVARFDGPRGVAVTLDGWVYVADTNNHLIRLLSPNGTVETLAGNLDIAEADEDGRPLPGCEPPCLKGVRGGRDGNLTYAQFSYPSSVAVGLNKSVIVADQHRVRMVSPPLTASTVQGIGSMGRVVTLAGQRIEGQRDGEGQEAQFSGPQGVTLSLPDGVIYVADALSCRIRRLSPASLIAEPVTCAARFTDVLRPSGCSSYDPPVDKRDKTASPVYGNVRYNYVRYSNISTALDGPEPLGRSIMACVGSPPPDVLDKRFWNDSAALGPLVIDDGRVSVKEDTGDGTTLRVSCPPGCLPLVPTDADVRGDTFYSDDSRICQAAIHAGVIGDAGGLVLITLQRGLLSANVTLGNGAGSSLNGIASGDVVENTARVVTLSAYPEAVVGVQTIAGHPAALLEDFCGMSDAQPPQEAKFRLPSGVALYINASVDDGRYKLFVADSMNHRLVALSAVCAFPCENMGRCVGPDVCECPAGWGGHDCSRPLCSTPCGPRQLCVAPDTCDCIPGYANSPACDVPLCVQTCRHGGSCVAPDTCSCAPGWFDANCTTPVCTLTCGNGGNCSAPDTCSCPSQWTGVDCRIPTCTQTCLNGGWCTAPDTCTCPPQWSGHDCALPVCMQGFLVPLPTTHLGGAAFGEGMQRREAYTPCTLERWCNGTNGFDCRQPARIATPLEIPSGPYWRNVTGRTDRPPQCTFIELERDAVSPFPYVQADNSTTLYARYTPLTPYQWDAHPKHPWSAYDAPTPDKTQPWSYELDRQVAFVEWRNVTQGVYVCANNGNCSAPDVCTCAPGWAGFDCRTPVCSQGYYVPSQETFVSGSGSPLELIKFEVFMGNNSARLQWPYSNPNYTLVREEYVNTTLVVRYSTGEGSVRYPGGEAGDTDGFQGGYRCSIRAFTQWENPSGVHSHPNFWSTYMDPLEQADGKNYTFWDGLDWPPVHSKSPQLQLFHEESQRWYYYSDQGYRLQGLWTPTGLPWQKGNCIVEFQRVCGEGKGPPTDLHSGESGVPVQDTDIAYRPRMNYTIWSALGPGRWFEEGGECVDHVLRGCYNNGTCVAPDTCQCASGWTGFDCSIPVCTQVCHHNGNCTLPNTCTCEAGWAGHDCSLPLCAQECNNGGSCIAPDTCQCIQWPSAFEDGRLHGGRPMYRKPDGEPQHTGWTGYDCATPICVQARRFILNVGNGGNGSITLGGHGKDGSLQCSSVRCPRYNDMVTQNDGQSFQTGCGFDPLDTGCCVYSPGLSAYECSICAAAFRVSSGHNFTCLPGGITLSTYSGIATMPSTFIEDNAIKVCGAKHNPDLYYRSGSDPKHWSANHRANVTSDRFLCNVAQWEQGDWLGSAGLGREIKGAGSDYGLDYGRHIRINDANITRQGAEEWVLGKMTRGEGIYECYNGGSCIAPDVCTCADGWGGFDCTQPLCRHRQASGEAVGCQNGGLCVGKDDCHCIHTLSVLSIAHPHLPRGVTGWSGTDCSMPMCTQGYYDPFCADLPQAPGNEGCYRCANGGNCTAPDFCECAPGWTGYDCRTPVCEAVADALTRKQLATVDEEVVHAFEQHPCSLQGVYEPERIGRVIHSRGNCSAPNTCSCLCKAKYFFTACDRDDLYCRGPWQDPMVRRRNVLPGPNYCFGTRDCADGYEGNQNDMDHFTTCHLRIYVPTWWIRYTRLIIVTAVLTTVFGLLLYLVIRRRLKRQYLLAKIERRRSRRSSEASGAAKRGTGTGGAGAGNLRARGNAFRST